MHEVPELQRARLANADALRDGGKLDEAIAEYRAIVEVAPDSAEAHFKLGTAFGRQPGDEVAAEDCYRRALTLWREYPEANNNLGLLLAGRCKFDEAEDHYRIALAGRPDFSSVHQNLGWLLFETARLEEARYHALRLQALKPESAHGHDLLGQVARAAGRISEAIRASRKAVELDPGFVGAWINLASCLSSCGRQDESDAALGRAMAIDPDCYPAWNNLLLSLNFRPRERGEVFERHRAYGAIVRRQCGELLPPAPYRPDPERRLRIGFLSGDLRQHSVTYFLGGPLEYLDRRQFQLFAYYNQRIEDDVNWRLKPFFHRWRSVYGLKDQAAADMIRADGIDIMIDLAGHTATARPLVLGRKPAPVMAHWIGYPNTTGLDCMDFRLTDGWADPDAEDDRYSTERLWRLPASFLCYSPPDAAPDPCEPPCLRQGCITFGSFNVRAKLSDECMDLWTRVLEAVPDSRLVLKSYLGAGDDEARAELRQLFVGRGIAADRIHVLEKRETTTDHLSAYGEMDIALDTFPYNGTTTTCEAIWMGVPVVTLAGDRHSARVGASLLNNADLGDLVAGSPDDFVAIACEMASDPQRLRSLRLALRDHLRASRLFDKVAMGADLGAALRGMWRQHCASFPDHVPREERSAVPTAELIRLHIGGRAPQDGWRIMASEQGDGIDYVGDVTNLDSFADESCSEIYCAHVLQRVPQAGILAVLAVLYRMLAPGGRLYVSVPDMEILSWLFVNPGYGKSDRFQVMRRMFGGQSDAHDFNKIGLYADLLADYLRDAGFASIEHVETFGLFDDASTRTADGHRVSLNLLAIKSPQAR